MRDHYELSGDFRGAVVNINSSLQSAEQAVSNSATSSDVEKAELLNLVGRLLEQLPAVEPDQAEAAEALAVSTKLMLEASGSDRPNRSLISGTIKAVLEGGKALLTSSPEIASTVNDIVDTVQKIHDLAGK